MEQAHEVLNAIIVEHIKSDTAGELSPPMLNEIGKFAEYTSWINVVISTDRYLGHFIRSIPLLKPNRMEAESRDFSGKER